MHFHAIASTGRTATTFLARALHELTGVVACHEGYVAADKEAAPLLPLINLENRLAYYSQARARDIVADKRGDTVMSPIARKTGATALIDVAYYNSVLADALLDAHPQTRIVAIIRELEPFVRSATAIEGEDMLPVGWPDPAKPLTPRERFIEMGRMKPRIGSSSAVRWESWSAIMRNIWLWQETNALLLAARDKHGGRVLLLPFEKLVRDAEGFMVDIVDHLKIPETGIPAAIASAQEHRNRKATGYQIGPMSEWSKSEQVFAKEAQEKIGNL
ncbi:sulfotransferase [Aurantiacibacter odishensis]|uniref:sulfotransferase n=1 Tax=Aurantiacibacter odishensis TaxID=1155476 RepID=UPI0013C50F18|nr:sulfotransferase [Aurantiacibacter odishensis]